MAVRDHVFFYLNGEPVEARGEELFLNLTDFLRLRKGLTGTKVVCAEGDCGACTILRAFPRPGSRLAPVFESINACIVRVAQVDASSIVSIEGLKGLGPEAGLHPVQEAMIRCHASQCGFCTPGFVMAITGVLEKTPIRDAQDAKNRMTGNLCRCTGYTPIIEAALSVDASRLTKLSSRYLTPSILSALRKAQKTGVCGGTESLRFEAPATLPELRSMRRKSPTSTLLGAGTDLGVASNKGRFQATHFLSLHLLAPLYRSSRSGSTLTLGARVSLSELRRVLEDVESVADFLNIFASPQIKNFATLAGNVANASPIADTPPFLLALDAELEVFSPTQTRTRRVLLKDFYLGYKKTDLKKGEIIWAIRMKLPAKNEHLSFSKVSQRRDLDISCVNTGFFFKAPPKKNALAKPAALRLALGGVAPTPLRLFETENFILKEGLSPATKALALKKAQSEISPLSDLRGSAPYRRLVVRNLLDKFLSAVMKECGV